DYVWYDNNENGVQDDGEQPVPGVTVILLDSDGEPVKNVDSVVTAEDGSYRFAVPCGAYRVEFTDLPDGSKVTDPGVGDDPAIDSNPDPETGITDLVVVG